MMDILRFLGFRGGKFVALTYRELSPVMQVRFGTPGFLETDVALSQEQMDILQDEWERRDFDYVGDGDRFVLTKDGLERRVH